MACVTTVKAFHVKFLYLIKNNYQPIHHVVVASYDPCLNKCLILIVGMVFSYKYCDRDIVFATLECIL